MGGLNNIQQTEEMRGIAPAEDPILQELNASNQYSKYLAASIRNVNNNFNLYKYNWLTSQYTPDDVDYDRVPSDFGKSGYDYDAPDLATVYGGLTDFRAAQQGPFLEALASLGQFTTRAVGTALEGYSLIPGALLGGIKHAVDYINNDPNRPEEDKHNLLYDIIFNPISQGINKAQDALIESMPIYKTAEELNNSWWTNVVKHPFTWITADVLPSAGFTIGAMVGGKLQGNKVNAILEKLFNKKSIIDKAAKLGIALEEIPDEQIPSLIENLKKAGAVEKLNIIDKYLKTEQIKSSISNWAGILNASATEATVEGYNTRKEYIDEVLPKAYNYMKSEYFQNQLHDNFQNDNEGFEDFEDYRAEKEREVIQNIVKTADNIGLTTYGANVAFLTAHNKFFWDSFFNPKFFLKNSVRDYTKLFNVTTENGLLKDIFVKDNFFLKHKTLGKAAYMAKNGLAEAFEEMSQGLFSESSKEGYGSKMNDMFFSDYNALLDPRYSKERTGFWGAVEKGFKETYFNPERWEEGVIGLLTGIIGLPNVGIHNGKVRNGKKGITGWTLGGIEEYKSLEEKYRQAEEMAKLFRSKEGNRNDSYQAIKEYLESGKDEQLSAIGSSPLNMLRTSIILKSIEKIANSDKETKISDNIISQLHSWKSNSMKGVLMGYDTYVQMGLSKYFDNWLNFLENINKPQNSQKAKELINDILSSNIFSNIKAKDGTVLFQNYSNQKEEMLLNSISENAKNLKELLKTYNKIDAELFDVFYNNFKGTPDAYMKVKHLIRGLTLARFFENFIFNEENVLPELNSKEKFYELNGFNELYDSLGQNDKMARVEALNNVFGSYVEILTKGIKENKYKIDNPISLFEKFAQYTFDIISSDRIQEHIYSITNPEAFNKASQKAEQKADEQRTERDKNDFKSRIKKALLDNSSMENDSEIVSALIEASSPNGEFNSDLILDIKDKDTKDLKKYLGITDYVNPKKVDRLGRLIDEIYNYTSLISKEFFEMLNNSYITDEQKEQLKEIYKQLQEGGLLANIHEKYNDLFNEYYALKYEKNSSFDGEFDEPWKQARYDVLSNFQLIKDLSGIFETYLEKYDKAEEALTSSEGAFQYITYSRSKNKTKPTGKDGKQKKGGKSEEEKGDLDVGPSAANDNSLKAYIKNIVKVLGEKKGTDVFDQSNLLNVEVESYEKNGTYKVSFKTATFDGSDYVNIEESLLLTDDDPSTAVISSSEANKDVKVRIGSVDDFKELTQDNGFSVFSILSNGNYSIGLSLVNPDLLSDANINKIRIVSPQVKEKKLPKNVEAKISEIYRKYRSVSKLEETVNKQPGKTKTTDTNIYDSNGGLVEKIELSDDAIKVLDYYNNKKIVEANRIISKYPKGNSFMNLLKLEGNTYSVVFPDDPSVTLLTSGLLKFHTGASIKNVTIEGFKWDIKIASVDNKGNISSIEEKSIQKNNTEYTLSFSNGSFDIKKKKNNNYKSQPLPRGYGYQFPISQVDTEVRVGKTRYENKLNTTEETDKSTKGKYNIYKYIRDEVLTPSGAYFSMIDRIADNSENETFKHNIGDTLYFDFIALNNDDPILKGELDKFYEKFQNLKKEGKLIGIYSSKDEATRELLGVVDLMASDILSDLNEKASSLRDVEYQIKDIITGNSNVIVENGHKKNSLDKLDVNNECMYVISSEGALYSNKSTRKDKKITKEKLDELLGRLDDDNNDYISINDQLLENRIYIFSPTRSKSENSKKRYTLNNSSVELIGLNKNGKNKDPMEAPESIIETIHAFAERWVNNPTLAVDEYHNINNLFYSTNSEFKLFENEDGVLKIFTGTNRNGNTVGSEYKELDLSNADSITKSILEVALKNDLTFPYKPDELFIDNNSWFNELKPFLETTKAFIGESNIYFTYGPKETSDENTNQKENSSQYIKPKIDSDLTNDDTKPATIENNTSFNHVAELTNYIKQNQEVQDLDEGYIKELADKLAKDIIQGNKHFSSDNKRTLSSMLEVDQIKELENLFIDNIESLKLLGIHC